MFPPVLIFLDFPSSTIHRMPSDDPYRLNAEWLDGVTEGQQEQRYNAILVVAEDKEDNQKNVLKV